MNRATYINSEGKSIPVKALSMRVEGDKVEHLCVLESEDLGATSKWIDENDLVGLYYHSKSYTRRHEAIEFYQMTIEAQNLWVSRLASERIKKAESLKAQLKADRAASKTSSKTSAHTRLVKDLISKFGPEEVKRVAESLGLSL